MESLESSVVALLTGGPMESWLIGPLEGWRVTLLTVGPLEDWLVGFLVTGEHLKRLLIGLRWLVGHCKAV